MTKNNYRARVLSHECLPLNDLLSRIDSDGCPCGTRLTDTYTVLSTHPEVMVGSWRHVQYSVRRPTAIYGASLEPHVTGTFPSFYDIGRDFGATI